MRFIHQSEESPACLQMLRMGNKATRMQFLVACRTQLNGGFHHRTHTSQVYTKISLKPASTLSFFFACLFCSFIHMMLCTLSGDARLSGYTRNGINVPIRQVSISLAYRSTLLSRTIQSQMYLYVSFPSGFVYRQFLPSAFSTVMHPSSSCVQDMLDCK